MPIDLWLAFVVASLIVLLIPGPTVLLTVSYALSRGRAAAVTTAAGVAFGDLIAMSASLAGLGALVLASAKLFIVLKWIGAVYLVWLGVGLLMRKPTDADMQTSDRQDRGRSIFLHATAVTALNPKSIVFFIAFVPQFIRPDMPLMPQIVILIATFVALAFLNALAYAFLADRMRRAISRPGHLRWLDRAGGAALIGMGGLSATMSRAA